MRRFPEIETVFEIPSETSNQLLYGEVIRNTLKKVLPENIFGYEEVEGQKEALEECFPLITATSFDPSVTEISFYCVLKSRPGFFKFFYEMLINWLVPGKQLDVVMLYAVDFKLPEVGLSSYTLCEVVIRPENSFDLAEIKRIFRQ